MQSISNKYACRRCGVALLVSALMLPACTNMHPRFGANDFARDGDRNGVPTYSASGALAYGEEAEEKVAKVMQAACPSGNPRLLSGYTMSMEGHPRKWNATFTCDETIPGL